MTARRIEFFHDVLCAYCYVASPSVHALAAARPDIEIVHRAFALAPTQADIVARFGSAAAAKRTLAGHWDAAMDAGRGIGNLMPADPERMLAADHAYPHSTPGLLATKAAAEIAGTETEWQLFDRIQAAHIAEARDIADPDVLRALAEEIGLNGKAFIAALESPSVAEAVATDLAYGARLGVRSVPTLVVSGSPPVGISATRSASELIQWANQVILNDRGGAH